MYNSKNDNHDYRIIVYSCGKAKNMPFIVVILQVNRIAGVYRQIVKMDCHYFKDTMKMVLGYPKDESTIIIKPSSPATCSTAVGISQNGEWI